MLTVQRSEKHEAELVTIPDRLRHMDEQRVLDMMESFKKIGQMTPIQVRIIGDGDDVVLVAGRHRLEAARRLGWDKILINVVEGDEIDYRLWEIAENLHRAELTVLERSQHLAEWIRLFQEHGEEHLKQVQDAVADVERLPASQIGPIGSSLASKGGRASTPRVGKSAHPSKPGGAQPNDAGISAAAKEFAVDRREVRRARKIDAISPEAKQAARVAGLEKNQSALLKVAAVPADEQVAKVEAMKAERSQPRASETKPGRPLSDRQQRHKILDVEVAEVIAALEDALGSRFEEIALLLCNVDLHRLHEKLVERLPD